MINNNPTTYDYDLGKYSGKRWETNIHNMTCHFINKNRVFSLLEKKLSIPHPESLHYANLKFHNVNIVRPYIQYYLDI
jgi:hypothetical protein